MNIHQSAPYAAGSYAGLTEVGETLFLPLLQRANANNTMYSDFTLFNVGASQTTAQVQYIPENGNYDGCTTNWIAVPANGSHNFDLRLNPECAAGDPMSSPFVGGARVSSYQPLVAVVNQWRYYNNAITGFMSYEGFPAGGTASYMPLLQYSNNGWYTSSTLQDTSGNNGNFTISYTPENGGNPCLTTTPAPLLGNDVEVVFPSPPAGSCTPQNKFVGAGYATRSNDFAIVVNQEEFVTYNKKMSYSAVRSGAAAVIVPWVMKNKDGWQGRDDWYSGLNVQNVGSADTNVTVRFYDNNGNLSHTEAPRTVSSGANIVYFPVPLDDGFVGSAVATTDNGQPIAVVVNHFSADPNPLYATDDTYMSHTGLNR